jgi:hypothetical protein
MTSTSTELTTALHALPQQWALTPVNQKKAYFAGWQQTGLSRELIEQEITSGKADGFGILTGELSGGLIAIDCDGHEPHARFREILGGEILATVSFASGRDGRAQYLYSVPQKHWASIQSKVENTSDGQLDFRWNGRYSVLPPSAHPETDGYCWVKSPDDCLIAQLPEKALEHLLNLCKPKVSTAKPAPKKADNVPPIPLERCLSKDHREALINGVGEGGRSNTAISLGRDLLGCAAWLDALNEPYGGDPQSIYIEYCDRCSPPINDRERDATWRSANKYSPEPSISDPEAFQNCIDKWKREHGVKVTQPTIDEDEPTKEEIGQRLVQQQEDFLLSELFSSEVANPLTQYCDRTGVPQGALAIFVITCLATLVNPNTFLDCGGGTGNKARPIFWVANYGVSGSGKSHGWKPPMDILREFTSIANSKYKDEKQNWDTAARAIKQAKNPAELSALSEDTRELADKEPPDRERFKMESFSIEALLSRQSKQPNRGLLAFADELLGWVQRMDPKKGEESLWLSLWLGDDLDGERIGRDVEYIERSAISVLGGIQPDVFRKLVEENEESQNGFLQRVILVRMPERPRPKMVNEPEPDYTPLKRIFENIKRYGGALELKLGSGGFEFAQKLKTFTDGKRLKESRKTIKALWPKFEATCYRIALILHLIENSDPDKVVPEDVPLKTLKTAWAYTEWLAGQAIQIYEEQLESDRVDVRVTEFVEAARYKDWMTVRDVRLLRRRWFKDTQEATVFMNRLVEMEYAETKLSPKGKPEFRISIFQKSGNMATNKTQNQASKALQVLPSVGNSGNKTENNGCENHIQSQDEPATVSATKLATEAPINDPLPENVAGFVAAIPESQNNGIPIVSADEISPMLPLLPAPGNSSNCLRESGTDLNVAMLPLFEEVEIKKPATVPATEQPNHIPLGEVENEY